MEVRDNVKHKSHMRVISRECMWVYLCLKKLIINYERIWIIIREHVSHTSHRYGIICESKMVDGTWLI